MRIPGARVRHIRLIQTDKLAVAVEIELVIPPDDPGEPCLESETVELLREIEQRAQRGDLEWLRGHAHVRRVNPR